MQSKQAMSRLSHKKKFDNWFPVAKTLIKFNSLEENDEEEKDPINTELTE